MHLICSLQELASQPRITSNLAAFLLAFALCAIFITLIRRYAPAWGLVDKPGVRKIHERVMPKGGGIAIVLSLFLAYGLSWYGLGLLTNWLSLPGPFSKETLAVLGGGLVIATLGLVDDWCNLKPWTKLTVESLVAFVLIHFDLRITLFVPSDWFSFFVTWGWIVLITNSFNLLDNMDGLSAGVAWISAAIFFAAAIQTGQWHVTFLLAGLLGSLLGFLAYNFPPASIFMGDCGSLFIGYFMAVLTIYATFYEPTASIFPVVLPLLAMAVPLFDTGTVAWLRWRQRRPIFQGDKQHFSHRLVELGLTRRQAVLTIYLVTFATGLSTMLLYQVTLWGAVIILVQIISLLAIIHILQQTAAQKQHDREQHEPQSPAKQ